MTDSILDKTVLNPGWIDGGPTAPTTGQALPNPDDPSVPISAYWAQAARWTEVSACMGGNDYLKLYGGNWIPKLKHESDECFARRLSLASFSPYFTRIIQAAIGLILRKPIKLEGADEEWWAQWRQNVDRQAGDLEAFAKRNLTVALAYGHCGILADYPQAQNIRTLRDEYDANLSPYLMNVEPWRIIGWREDSSSTVSRLDQVRIRETTTVPRGMFGEETWRQIRVLSPGRFEVYRASAPQETGGVGTVDLAPAAGS